MPLRLGAKIEISSALGAGRQDNAYERAARGGIDIDPAVVIEDGAFHDGEAKPHAARLCRAERRKNLVSQFGVDAFPVVLDGNDNAIALFALAKRFRRQGDAGLVLTR